MADKIYSFLGLAKKAGRLVAGGKACERALKSGKICLVIITEDAAENTRKKFGDMCGCRGIEMICFGKKETLGKFTGKDSHSVVAISDRGFAERLKEMTGNFGKEDGGV